MEGEKTTKFVDNQVKRSNLKVSHLLITKLLKKPIVIKEHCISIKKDKMTKKQNCAPRNNLMHLQLTDFHSFLTHALEI
jgi:hypothetical protein